MKYLILGTVLALAGIGMISTKHIIWGALLLIVGVVLGVKGRQKTDKPDV